MNEPVLMQPDELKQMRDDMKKVVDINEGLKRDVATMKRERDEARQAATRAKNDAEQLRKQAPEKQVKDENVGLRSAVSEAHREIAALKKELAAVKVESEGRRKEVVQSQQRLGNVQNTFDMMQVARDKAYFDRDKALADLQDAGNAYHKLQGEFNDFRKAVEEKAQAAKEAHKSAKA